MRNVCALVTGLAVAFVASTAMAQGETQPPGEGTLPPPRPAAGASASASVNVKEKKAAEKEEDGTTDHEKVVGKIGVMYFGISQQPIGGPVGTTAAAVTKDSVQTPVIGARYWLQERLGVDAGLGFMMQNSSNATQSNNGPEVNTDGPAAFAFALHGGVPLAFAYAKHYKFLVVPELNFGYATRTIAAQNPPPGTVIGDVHLTGFRFDVGARVGTEIQFGFIGIPELALQASIGAQFRRQVWHASQEAGSTAAGPTPSSSSSIGQNDLSTTVQADPWTIFTGNIAAIYYFP
jgi:hypothetical protein